MNREMLMLVDAISREKNVERDVVFGAVEAALAQATKKLSYQLAQSGFTIISGLARPFPISSSSMPLCPLPEIRLPSILSVVPLPSVPMRILTLSVICTPW